MDTNNTLYQQLFKESFDTYLRCNSDLVTFRSIKIDLITRILKDLRMPLKLLNATLKKNTVLHDEWIGKLSAMVDEEHQAFLAQKLLKSDKLVRILKDAIKDVKTLSEVEESLAVDGLHGNLTHGPNFEYKHYLSNLILPTDENAPLHQLDENPDFKHRHVRGVRAMYEVARKKGQVRVDPVNVYLILCQIAYDTTETDLPRLKDEYFEQVDPDLFQQMRQAYLQRVDRETFQALVKSLRYRGEKRSPSDDEATGGKRRKSGEKEVEKQRRGNPDTDGGPADAC